MELLNFIFRLGVLFAIYGFLWAIFEFILAMITSGRSRSLIEVYIIRGIKYLFLVNVTFIFCYENSPTQLLAIYKTIFAGLILLTYFTGKLQKNQLKSVFLNISKGNLMNKSIYFDVRFEKIIISIALIAFTLLWFFPDYAVNPISTWFKESIINIEETPIFGFVFKVIGFFFLMNLIGKMISAVNSLINGDQSQNNDDFTDSNSLGNDGEFVEYEEVD